MNTRTRLETTAHQGFPPTSRRWAVLLAACGMMAVVLAGCAEGTANDAARGKARDSERTSVVGDMQATQAAQVLQPGTPPPSTPTPET